MGWEHAVPEWQVWIAFFAAIAAVGGIMGIATYYWTHRRKTWRR